MTMEYVRADTPIHRLNPVVKFVYMGLTLALVFIANFSKDILALLIWLAVTLGLWRVGGVSIRYMKTILKVLAGVSVFILVVQGFMYRSETETPLFTLFHLRIWGGADIGVFTLEGLLFGLLIVARVFTAVAAVPLVTMTTSPSKLMECLARLRIPFTYAFMLVTAMRFVPTIQETWSTIVDAQKLRGFDLDKMNFLRKALNYIPITTPLVLILLRRANDLQIAIELRAFGAPVKRTFVEDVEFHLRDKLFLTFSLALFAICVIFREYYAQGVWEVLVGLLPHP